MSTEEEESDTETIDNNFRENESDLQVLLDESDIEHFNREMLTPAMKLISTQ